MEQEKAKLKLVETWKVEKYEGDVVSPENLIETVHAKIDENGVAVVTNVDRKEDT